MVPCASLTGSSGACGCRQNDPGAYVCLCKELYFYSLGSLKSSHVSLKGCASKQVSKFTFFQIIFGQPVFCFLGFFWRDMIVFAMFTIHLGFDATMALFGNWMLVSLLQFQLWAVRMSVPDLKVIHPIVAEIFFLFFFLLLWATNVNLMVSPNEKSQG